MSNKTLYRDTRNGKLSGVCAGIARYFDIEVWFVRILFISATLLGGTMLVLLTYVGLSFLVEPMPSHYRENDESKKSHKLKSRPWKQGESVPALLRTIEQELDEAEAKTRHIEAYVTSETYKVNKAFRQL